MDIYLYLYIFIYVDITVSFSAPQKPDNRMKRRADCVSLQAINYLRSSLCLPRGCRYTISKTALKPFVNVICLIALYQYTDETCELSRSKESVPDIFISTPISSYGFSSIFIAQRRPVSLSGGETDRAPNLLTNLN